MDPSDACRFWPYAITDGYGDLRIGKQTRRVHILTCERWHGPRPEGTVAAHFCGKPLCWAGEHLRWATFSENTKDAVRHGTHVATKAKMTPNEVRAIRERYAAGGISQQELATAYGLTQAVVSKMILRQTWRNVP